MTIIDIQFGTTPILLAQKIGSLDVIEYLTRKHGCQVSLAMLDVSGINISVCHIDN